MQPVPENDESVIPGKACRTCGSRGPLVPHKGCRDGVMNWCKACKAVYAKINYAYVPTPPVLKPLVCRVCGSPGPLKKASKDPRGFARICVTCKRSYDRAYGARYVRQHADRIRARKHANRAARPDLWRAEWLQTNHRRRARKLSAAGTASKVQLESRMAFYGYRCAYCSGPFEHVDHVIPLSKGGSNWPANLRPACADCNRAKGSRMPKEWLQ